MGSDSLLQLETWHEPEELLSLCSLAVAPRPGDAPEAIAAAAARWGDHQVDAARRAAAGRLLVGHPRARGAAAPHPLPRAAPRGAVHPGDGAVPVTGIDRAAAEELIAARLSPRRRDHAHRVAAEAVVLAERFGASPEAAELAGPAARLLPRAPRRGDARRRRPLRHPGRPGRGAAAQEDPARPGGRRRARRSAASTREIAAAIRLHTVGDAGHDRRSRSACTWPTTWSRAATSRASTRCARWRTTSLDAAVGAAARLSLLDIIGRGRGVVPGALALYNETHAEALRDTAATVCAAGAAPRSSARRPGSSTCWRRSSPSPRSSAPGTSRAASPRTSRSPRRAATSRPSSSRRRARRHPVAALLVVQDPSGGDPGVYLVPPDLLLEGPNGEYVFAADAMAAGHAGRRPRPRRARAHRRRVHACRSPTWARWAGTDELQVELERPGERRRRRPHAGGRGRRRRRRRRPAGDLRRRRAATGATSPRCRSRWSSRRSRRPPCGPPASVAASPA